MPCQRVSTEDPEHASSFNPTFSNQTESTPPNLSRTTETGLVNDIYLRDSCYSYPLYSPYSSSHSNRLSDVGFDQPVVQAACSPSCDICQLSKDLTGVVLPCPDYNLERSSKASNSVLEPSPAAVLLCLYRCHAYISSRLMFQHSSPTRPASNLLPSAAPRFLPPSENRIEIPTGESLVNLRTDHHPELGDVISKNNVGMKLVKRRIGNNEGSQNLSSKRCKRDGPSPFLNRTYLQNTGEAAMIQMRSSCEPCVFNIANRTCNDENVSVSDEHGLVSGGPLTRDMEKRSGLNNVEYICSGSDQCKRRRTMRSLTG